MSSGLRTSLDQRTFAHHIQGKGPLFGIYNGPELLGLVGGDLNKDHLTVRPTPLYGAHGPLESALRNGLPINYLKFTNLDIV